MLPHGVSFACAADSIYLPRRGFSCVRSYACYRKYYNEKRAIIQLNRKKFTFLTYKNCKNQIPLIEFMFLIWVLFQIISMRRLRKRFVFSGTY